MIAPNELPRLNFVLRPDRTAIWLPKMLFLDLGLTHGQQLTPAQYRDPRLQELILKRAGGNLND